MSADLATRRKKLSYRCWHRGTKELDLFIGSFADRHLAAMSEAELDLLEALLAVPEPTLYAWITGSAAPSAEFDNEVTRRLLAYKIEHPIH